MQVEDQAGSVEEGSGGEKKQLGGAKRVCMSRGLRKGSKG
jgi:hypothetical protein